MNELLAGAVSGLITCVGLQPLDVVKTRLQESTKNSTWRVISDLYVKKGPFGFWRGTGPSLLRTVPGSTLYFSMIHQCKYLLLVASIRWPKWSISLVNPETHLPTKCGNLLIGSACRSAAGFILMPTSVVKTRFESQKFGDNLRIGIFESFLSIWKSDGVKGLWRGWGSTIMRDAPYAGLYLAMYETVKPLVADKQSLTTRAVSASLAGALATMATHPFDLIRTKIQLDPSTCPNTYRTMKVILKGDSGLAGLYRGLVPRLARKSLSSAIAWATFEELVTYYRL